MSFSDDMRRATDEISTKTEKSSRKIIQALFNNVIRDTPADTGRLKGAWAVGVGSPPAGNRNRVGAGGPLGAGRAKVNRPGIYYLANNLPYAPVAEYGRWGTGINATEKTTRDGYSVQAPMGMVRINVIKITKRLKAFTR